MGIYRSGQRYRPRGAVRSAYFFEKQCCSSGALIRLRSLRARYSGQRPHSPIFDAGDFDFETSIRPYARVRWHFGRCIACVIWLVSISLTSREIPNSYKLHWALYRESIRMYSPNREIYCLPYGISLSAQAPVSKKKGRGVGEDNPKCIESEGKTSPQTIRSELGDSSHDVVRNWHKFGVGNKETAHIAVLKEMPKA